MNDNMESRVKASILGMSKAFIEAGAGNDLQTMLAATAILLGTIAASFPDERMALNAAVSSARGVMKALNKKAPA